MALFERFDPPAFLADFDGISGQREAWSRFISLTFDAVVRWEQMQVGPDETVSYFNPTAFDPGGGLILQPIVWNAFPKELLRQFGRKKALVQADTLWPLPRYLGDPEGGSSAYAHTFYRPQDEYCEWHVQRDPHTNKIVRVTFSSEPPEFWQALSGMALPVSLRDNTSVGLVSFPGDKDRLVALYRQYVSPDVQLADLFATDDIVSPSIGPYVNKGDYNPYNKWNTYYGAMHLHAPPNNIAAEIQLAGDATILYINGKKQAVVDPQALVCCAGYGGPDRNSDPTIGATVNALARLGARITLPNPVGLYMDHIDLAGWAAPDGTDPSSFVQIVRGQSTMIERMVVEVPASAGFVLGDVTIGDESIMYGGQIAECITVKLVGGAGALGSTKQKPQACTSVCCVDPAYATTADPPLPVGGPVPPGQVIAFRDDSGYPLAERASARSKSRVFRR